MSQQLRTHLVLAGGLVNGLAVGAEPVDDGLVGVLDSADQEGVIA